MEEELIVLSEVHDIKCSICNSSNTQAVYIDDTSLDFLSRFFYICECGDCIPITDNLYISELIKSNPTLSL